MLRSPVPKCEGPGAPSAWLEKITGTGGTRGEYEASIPGPQMRGTGGTLNLV